MTTSSESKEPLGLTVYDLPDPLSVDAPASGRGKLLAVVLACSLPLLLAYLIFFMVKPSGQASYGTLIHPARPVPELQVQDVRGQSVDLQQLKGQWLLINLSSGACQETCAQHLFVQRQLREMLSKDKDRVDRVWLILDDASIPDQLAPLLKDVTVLRVPPSVAVQWLGQADLQQASDQMFVVDPLGNAMLRMPVAQDGQQAHAALEVLRKLLAASAVWDMPGR